MRVTKFKAQPTNAFSLPSITLLNDLINDNCSLGCSQKQGGAAEHLIDGSEKRICRLTFEYWSPHVIEKRSNQKLIR